MTTVIVSGAIANKCLNGGATWTRLNWILGLEKLGFHVYFVEEISPENCTDTTGVVTSFADSIHLKYFREVTLEFGLADSSALIYDSGRQIYGMSRSDLFDLASEAVLLVNITGHLTWPPLMRRLRHKVYVDLDPGYTQFWHAAGNPGPRLAGHDFYFTIGENIGTPACPIPGSDICWRHTRQPVVLEYWPISNQGCPDRFTTLASWRGPYGPLQFKGKTFGLKAHEFRKFVELPQQTGYTFEIALDIHPADAQDLQLLHQHGWRLVEPDVVARDPMKFQHYVQTSSAEFSVAQGIYVETQCGWFSDRTVRYLASGKPALVQDTGFSRNYPVGEGLLTFRTLEEASAGAQQIANDYEKHSRAARALAETHFDSAKVLGRLIEEVGITP